MTKTFERFLRSFTDEELSAFAQDRGRVRPPYWRAMRLALQVEAARRELRFDRDAAEVVAATSSEPEPRPARPSDHHRAERVERRRIGRSRGGPPLDNGSLVADSAIASDVA